MKKLNELKDNNKGFSLVELIVVIAVMAVLISVLGSTILGYIEESKYAKDMNALDAIETAISAYVADGDSKYQDDNVYKLSELIEHHDPEEIILSVLQESFTEKDGKLVFNNFTSKAFTNITADDVDVHIDGGSVSIRVLSKDSEFDSYIMGSEFDS